MTTRRGHGEGTIRKRPDGRYEARYTDSTGKRRSVYGANRKAVHDMLAIALRLTQQGIKTNSAQTTADFLNHWIPDTITNTARPKTIERYAGIVTKYLLPTIGNVPVARLTPEHVERLHRQLAQVSPETRRYVHAVLRSALNQAVQRRLIERNPALLVKPARVHRGEIHTLDQ